MKKYQDKYRIASARWQQWDYSWAGAYFITICTKNRVHHFGAVRADRMQLSPVGAIADVLWYEIKNHAKNVELGEWIVMPNHVHGILILSDPDRDGNRDVETRHALSLPPPKSPPPSPRFDPPPQFVHRENIGKYRFRNQGKNTISSIVGGYKSAVTKHARRLGFEFGWQARFWDYVIRDEDTYRRIAHYIINNPNNWADDRLNGGKGNVVMEDRPLYGEEDWLDIL